jgi:hypothetical protein
MTKVRSPLTVLILLFVAFLSACHHHLEGHHPVPPPLTTLKIVINGPTAILWQKSAPSSIIVFSPRDPQDIHRLYVNNLEDGKGQRQNYEFKLQPDYEFELQPDGLKPATVLSIDPYLADFNLQTDKWVPEKYFVTIKLPVPDRITFAPPLNPIIFADGKSGYMATNFILEYRVTDRDKIHLDSPQLGKLRPLSSSELQEQYAKLCDKPDEGKRFHDSCIEVRNLLEQCAGNQTSVFFFGVGIPVARHKEMTDDKVNYHAVYFFNEVLLSSFPNLKDKRLATVMPPPKKPTGGTMLPRTPTGDTNGYLVPISLKLPVPRQPMLNMSAVIDCKAGGVIVRTTQ